MCPNLDKYVVAAIGVLENINVALCGMKSINLTKESTKNLGIHISYNKKIEDDLNFSIIKNLCVVIKLWRMRKWKAKKEFLNHEHSQIL